MEPDVARRLLAQQMSDISERCWSATWLVETEYVLWQAIVEGPVLWGQAEVTADDVNALKQLSEAAGGWIFNLAGDEIFVPMERWEKVYAIWAKRQKRQK